MSWVSRVIGTLLLEPRGHKDAGGRSGSLRSAASALDLVAHILAALYAADRILKLGMVAHFFARRRPDAPSVWPSVTLVQPVTRGASDLRGALEARAGLHYPARVQHLLVCDSEDVVSLALCCEWLGSHDHLEGEIIRVESAGGVAAKTVKLQAGLARAEGDVVCCVDDDIVLRPDALEVMVLYLYAPGAGAVFGLACYSDWSNVPSSLMSAFVNANALLSYIPATYLAEAFTITGHIFALKRETLDAVRGFEGLENNVGDDHQLAQRIRSLGLGAVQTPMIYDVENHFATFSAYAAQMKRWFVMPRQALLPLMTTREKLVTFAGSAGNLLPGLLGLLAVATRTSASVRAFAASMALFSLIYALCERLYLRRSTPLRRWPLVWLAAIASPFQVIGALLSSNEVEWRGKRIIIERGGDFRDAE